MFKKMVVFITAMVFFIGVTPAFGREGKAPTPNKKAYEHASDMAKFKRTGDVNKDADKAAKKARKEAEIAKKEAEKEARKAQKEADKAAKKTEKEAKKKQKEAEKEAKKAQKRLGR